MPTPPLHVYVGGYAVVLEQGFFAGRPAKKHLKRTARASKCLSKRKLHWVRCLANFAKKHGVPAELPIMTALVESSFTNPSGGDRDSVGMFQQRPPWGPYRIRHSPCKAVKLFILGGKSPGTFGAVHYKKRYGKKGSRFYGEWCQAVQRSAFPRRYQNVLRAARRLLKCAGVPPGLKLKPPPHYHPMIEPESKGDNAAL